MRIQVHPHRLITAETSEDEAKRINEKASEVGEAAASLLDYFTVGTVRISSNAQLML